MKKQKTPNQRPEVYRKDFEENYGITVTPEKLFRFMNAVTQNLGSGYQPPSEEDTKAAAAFLFELAQAAKYGDSWEPYKKRMGVKKIRDKMFDPKAATLDSPAFGIVISYVLGKITHAEAKSAFAENVQPASDRQIENWIAAIKPRVETTLRSLNMLRKTPGVVTTRSDPDAPDLIAAWADKDAEKK